MRIDRLIPVAVAAAWLLGCGDSSDEHAAAAGSGGAGGGSSVVCSDLVAHGDPALGTGGKPVWARNLDAGSLGAIALTAADDVILAGSFAMDADLGGGPILATGGIDMFVAKLDPSGAHVWSKPFGGAGQDRASAVAVAPDGSIALAGSFEDEIDLGGGKLGVTQGLHVFVAKLDPTGNHLWSKAFEGLNDSEALALAIDAATGDVLLAGYAGADSDVPIDFGGGPMPGATRDAFVVRFDPDGAHLWSHRYVGEGDDRATGMAIDPDGNIVLGGIFGKTLDLGGGALSAASYYSGFLLQLDPDGAHRWSKAFDVDESDDGIAVAADASGAVLVAGTFSEEGTDLGGGREDVTCQRNAFVAKLDGAGKHQWTRSFGGTDEVGAKRVAVDSKGNVVASGIFKGTADFGGGPVTSAGSLEAFALELDPAGGHLWNSRFGGDGHYESGPLAIDASDHPVVTGTIASAVDIGGVLLKDAAGYLYAAKLQP